MSGQEDKKPLALDRLADACVDDILQASDEEILAEFAESHGDPTKNAADMRALFERTLLATNKHRLKAARADLDASRHIGRAMSSPAIDVAQARQRLRRLLASGNIDQRLTLAARKEDELSDADVLGIIQDLEELGALPPDDDTGSQQ